MAQGDPNFPTHDYLTLHGGATVYRGVDWWKAVVRYQYGDNEDHTESAIYLWHHDGTEWSRKNKYVIKTESAWKTDQPIIEQYLESDAREDFTGEFPISDYYRVNAGETVFKNDEWWKAIVHVDQKGSWDTSETIIYVWQHRDGDWKRRQKYAIKNADDWADDRAVVNDVVRSLAQTTITTGTNGDTATGAQANGEATGSVSAELNQLEQELQEHLSHELIDDSG